MSPRSFPPHHRVIPSLAGRPCLGLAASSGSVPGVLRPPLTVEPTTLDPGLAGDIDTNKEALP